MAYRDAASCPGCGQALHAEPKGKTACKSCHGLWIDRDTLGALWSNRADRDLRLLPRRDRQRPRACPVCRLDMERLTIDAVSCDRCEKHGVWFDAGGFDRVLSSAGLAAAEGLPREHPCPRCDQPLVSWSDGRTHCDVCGGDWITADELATLWAAVPRRRRELPAVVPREDVVPPNFCPECAAPLEKAWFDSVAIDRCADHGLWFDRGDLDAALRRMQ